MIGRSRFQVAAGKTATVTVKAKRRSGKVTITLDTGVRSTFSRTL